MFYKDNLSLIRQWRGYSQKALSQQGGLSQAEISKYESGSMIPDELKLECLSSALEVPKSLFSIRDLIQDTGISFYRKQNKLSQKDSKKIESLALLKRFHIQKLLRSLEVELNRPDESSEDPIELARQIRSHWEIAKGPIHKLCQQLESHGVVICESSFKTEAIDGFFISGEVPVIFINDSLSTDRFLFTVAHELGHLLMHSVWSPKNEKEANLFAAELLMPSTDIAEDFSSEEINLERLSELKPKWNVSMQALLYRAGELGYLSDSKKRRLWTEMGKLGYRKREPISLDLEKQKPQLIQKLFFDWLDSNKRSIKSLARELKIYDADLVAMYSFLQRDSEEKINKPVYSGNLTAGALLYKESKIVASMLNQGTEEFDVRRQILDENLFQNGSSETTRKYLNLIFQRFHHLNDEQLKFISQGDEELVSMTLFYGILKSNRLVIDFLYEVLADKMLRYDKGLTRQEWMIFLDEKSTACDTVMSWSENSKKKVGQVIYKILYEAGYLSDTRSPEIICPQVPYELTESLIETGEEKFLMLMELRAQ